MIEPQLRVLLRYNFSVQKLRAIFGGSSPIAVTAFLSVLVLVCVSTARVVAFLRPPVALETALAASQTSTPSSDDAQWQQEMLLLGLATSTDADMTATSTDHLSMIGPMIAGQILDTYSQITANGNYTQQDLRTAAEKIAVYMKAAVSYDAFENSDFKTDADVSSTGVRAYRDNLLKALEPISSIPGAEYEIYGRYVETSDPKYLVQLKDAANTYRTAAANAAAIRVPSDAINYHREVLNSLRAFASVLDGLADHADDPFASVALLRTYNEKEQGIHDSYDRMRSYYAKKSL